MSVALYRVTNNAAPVDGDRQGGHPIPTDGGLISVAPGETQSLWLSDAVAESIVRDPDISIEAV